MEQLISFLFLTLLPFGQIIKIGFINPIDTVVLVGAVWAILRKYKKPNYFKYLDNFLLIAFFSWIVGSIYFWDVKVLYGLLYLIRLASYFYFSLIFHRNKKNQKFYINSLIFVGVTSAIFGWIQYFWIPDFKAFTIWGWDDHLYRLIGTFMDPGFLGIILVITSLFAFTQKKYVIFSFLLLSILFTYSRASYLALFVGMYLVLKNFKKFLIFAGIMLLLIGILPRRGGEGVKLERTYSTIKRIENYQQTLGIFKQSPIFGIGFNNICLARQKFIGIDPENSHSCNGADAGLLLILATTGVVGLITFIYMVNGVALTIDLKKSLLPIIFLTVFVHSFFNNTLFYPHVMGILSILLGVSGGKVKS